MFLLVLSRGWLKKWRWHLAFKLHFSFFDAVMTPGNHLSQWDHLDRGHKYFENESFCYEFQRDLAFLLFILPKIPFHSTISKNWLEKFSLFILKLIRDFSRFDSKNPKICQRHHFPITKTLGFMIFEWPETRVTEFDEMFNLSTEFKFNFESCEWAKCHFVPSRGIFFENIIFNERNGWVLRIVPSSFGTLSWPISYWQ